jgi:serine/threonine protein kinase
VNGPAREESMRFEDYEILAELGRARSYVCHRARHRQTGQVLALQWAVFPFPACEVDAPVPHDEFLARHEAVALLDHPHLVRVLAVGEYNSNIYLARPLPQGPTLTHLLGQGPIEPRRAVLWAAQIADAVGHAHDHGIFGCDISAEQVWIFGDEVRLCLSYVRHVRFLTPLPQTCELNTTCMSPERVRGDSRLDDPPSDVWELGMLLFQMLTAAKPFPADSTIELFEAMLGGEPLSVRALRPEIDSSLDSICQRCLKYKPEDRYPNMVELRETLRAYLDGRLIENDPAPSLGARMGRWVRRWWPVGAKG